MDFHPWASRAIPVFSFRLPEPSLSSHLGFQSHHYCLVQASRAITIVSFRLPEPSLSSHLGFQSHHYCLIQASRAITVFSFRLPEPSLSSHSGFQSHHCRFQSHHYCLVQASRAITIVSFRLPEPSLSSHLGFQSHHYCLVQASRAITVVSFRLPEPSLSSRLGFQSHYCPLASRAVTVVLFRLPELLFSSLAFRVSFLVWLLELLFSWFQCLESALSSRVTTLGVHIRWLYASCLHGFTFSLGFSSLRYLVLITYSSRSSHRAVSFRRVLVCAPRWFDHYSPLASIFKSLLETF
ncbi:hypothetical protein CK203_063028 [Vitis vinifera]|uniref:Uncharacterized protein n=1 Tax=Vitis vinifera TaxID=29760 RepID=A0A438G5J1_VITVI|nr:hypothetical protein CK203_063028 [Vitis vinifera]